MVSKCGPRQNGMVVLLVAAAVYVGSSLVAPAYGQVYKWVDEKGVTHYSQSPPPGGPGKASVLKLPDSSSSRDPADQNWQAKELEFQERQAKQADARKQAEEKAEKEAAARHRSCLQAQDALDSLQRARRLYNVNEQGERVYLSDDDRARETQIARQRIADNCQ